MTKLEWCRLNTPEALRGEPDEFILEAMSAAYNIMLSEEAVDCSKHVLTHGDGTDHLAIMVSSLAKEFGTDLVFEQGYMLAKVLRVDVQKEPNLFHDIDIKLQLVCRKFKEYGLIDDYSIIGTLYRKTFGNCLMSKSGNLIMSIVIDWNYVTQGTAISSINIIDMDTNVVEHTIASKLISILSNKNMKDLYDLFCICEYLPFNAKEVYEHILLLTCNKDVDWCNLPYTDGEVREYAKGYAALELRSVYFDDVLKKPEFNLVMDRFYAIAERVRDSCKYNHNRWVVNGHYFVGGV